MPQITKQKQFQQWTKPTFCYLCGGALNNGTLLNSDHCPPASMFLKGDRQDYPIILKVHKACNHEWHAADEKFAVMYGVMHGIRDEGIGRRQLGMGVIESQDGAHLVLTDLPLRPLIFRIVRCAHALLYGAWLPAKTPNTLHIPVPEADPSNKNLPRAPAAWFKNLQRLCVVLSERARTIRLSLGTQNLSM